MHVCGVCVCISATTFMCIIASTVVMLFLNGIYKTQEVIICHNLFESWNSSCLSQEIYEYATSL